MDQTDNQPQIAEAIRRIENIVDRVGDLNGIAKAIANRLQHGTENVPEPPTPVTPERDYGGGLTDLFLRQHDRLDLILDQLAASLGRIGQVV